MESLIGKTIDGYRIIEVIGRGGMGVVLKAIDTSLEKIVALKMIDPFLARDENFVRRFKTEAKALAKLENPNIVVVHALRETKAGFFMVMEYVESKPISHHLTENGPFGINETVAIAKQLVNAVAHAHKAGIIHRDIKPSNILLCYDGKIKVTDFGLAKVIQQKGPGSTVTQARAGTLYYMSPEQIKGLKNVDIRSDIYSLGMTIYEMIAGRVPFEKTESDFTIQKQIVEGEIPSPVKFNSSIPKKLTKIILKAIEKDPDKRYQNAEEIFTDLEKFEKEYIEERKTIIQEIPKSPAVKFELKSYLNKVKSYLEKFGKIQLKKPGILISAAAVILLMAVFLLVKNSDSSFPISINTIPEGANIMINGQDAGKSPLNEFNITNEGYYKIKIVKSGFTGIDTSINFTSDISGELIFKLREIAKRKIIVQTTPSDAETFIDNIMIGFTPLENIEVTKGEHKIKIEKEKYFSIDTAINIKEEGNNLFVFNLIEDKNYGNFGTLRITTKPSGASVFIDGKFKGKTPYENKELSEKNYIVKIQKEGFNIIEENVKILQNETKKLYKELQSAVISKKENFYLRINTSPEDAEIFVNDKLIGKTPIDGHPIKNGEYKISVKRSGFQTIFLAINIDSDTSIYRLLTPTGKLVIKSKPEKADVYINEKYVGTTPFASDQIIFGSQNVLVKNEGYKSYSENVILSSNNPSKELFASLEPMSAKIDISINPRGDIYVDDKLFMRNVERIKEVKIPFGKHTLKVVFKDSTEEIKVFNVKDETPQSLEFGYRNKK